MIAASPDALILGAGIAGLSAAKALTARGLRVVVLEGRDRIGGRVWTDESWPGLPLDMGAGWIHGLTGNPITTLARELELDLVVTDYDSLVLYDEAGRRLPQHEAEALDTEFAAVLAELAAERQRRQAAGAPDISLAEAFDQAVARRGLDAQARQRLAFQLNLEVEHEFAADAADLSFYLWDSEHTFPGQDAIFPQGYSHIARALAAGLDIRLQHTVSHVAYDAAGVTVTTDRGVFVAERAVATLPLGVLKQGRVSFAPPLPTAKAAAIERLGMNVLNRVYLRFPTVFWAADDASFIGHIGAVKGEWPIFMNFHALTGAPVLLAFNAGLHGTAIENLSDEAIVAGMLAVLRRLYGASVPEPEAWLITRWLSDPFAGGSYSSMAPGSTLADREALSLPLGDRLFFAGEATHLEYPSTVHGAHLSGLRAANQLLDLATSRRLTQ